MPDLKINRDPSKRLLRNFAWLVAFTLAVLSWPHDATPAGQYLRLAAAAVFAIGTVLPRTLRWPLVVSWVAVFYLAMLLSRPLPAAWRIGRIELITAGRMPVPPRRERRARSKRGLALHAATRTARQR